MLARQKTFERLRRQSAFEVVEEIAKLQKGNGKTEYDFGSGEYDTATETLSIPCKPGEVIAYGQKNYKKAKRTIHEVRLMTAEGRLVTA